MQVERGYRYNLMPFVEIRRFWKYRDQLGNFAVFSNIFGNVIGFLPWGFILPIIFRSDGPCFSYFPIRITTESDSGSDSADLKGWML